MAKLVRGRYKRGMKKKKKKFKKTSQKSEKE